MLSFDLSGRVALVTGGTSGIGLAIASALGTAGAEIAVAGRNADRGTLAARQLEAAGVRCSYHSADVSREADCLAVVDGVTQKTGRLDILVNNAGTTIRKRPEELSFEEWRHVLDVNLSSAFMMCKASHGHMRDGGGGKIINIASVLAIVAAPFSAAYSASKAGLVQLTKALATAWAADNIQVNAILPGWVETELTNSARRQVPGLNEAVLARTPAGRWGRPEDITGAALFLATGPSDFVTGAALPVDGGYTAQA